MLLTYCVALADLSLTRPGERRGDGAIAREIEKLGAASDIPGLVVAVVTDDALVHETYRGLADVAAKRPVAETTPFALATHAHAFIAVALLRLEEEQRLSLSDPVSKHLPWFWVSYGDARPSVTLGELLHQTSGIADDATGHRLVPLPQPSGSQHALEATARALVGSRLRALPGREFTPATANDELLALVVQVVTGRPFTRYLNEEVLAPLGLEQTRAGEPEAQDAPVGYKPCFGVARRLEGSTFAGAPPSTHVVSTPHDMLRWARLQLRPSSAPPELAKAIARSRAPDLSVPPSRRARSTPRAGRSSS